LSIDYTREGKIAIFTINRPEARNAMGVDDLKKLHDVMIEFRDDSELWVGVITGAGEKAFCAGADVNDMLPFDQKYRSKPEMTPSTPMRGLELSKPLIAAMNGSAFGGGLEIALSCDIRIASETAKMGLTEVNLGLIPGWGGTQRLPRIVPLPIAAEMLFAGKVIDAPEAYRIGLVNRIVPQEQVMPAAMELASTICKAAPLAVRAVKEAMMKGVNLTLTEGLQLEDALVISLLKTEDFAEGLKAFNEKRAPEYKAK
jgi:enoyl-CoA hydratase/carnithine racemase